MIAPNSPCLTATGAIRSRAEPASTPTPRRSRCRPRSPPTSWALSASPTPFASTRPTCARPRPQPRSAARCRATAPGRTESGLSPQQVRSLYSAGALFAKGPRGQGRGTVSAVFELSGYTQHDITVFAHTFLGERYTPPLRNINVDGGPVHGTCPKHDHLFPPRLQLRHRGRGRHRGAAGDGARAQPAARLQRAQRLHRADDRSTSTSASPPTTCADTVSTSWGFCEPGVGISYARAENVIFTQMAMQGQSITSSSGDAGAFDCLLDGRRACHAADRRRSHLPAAGDQRGRHLVRDVRPRPQQPPVLSARARDGLEPAQRVQRHRRPASTAAPSSAPAAAACRGSGRGRPTSSAPA